MYTSRSQLRMLFVLLSLLALPLVLLGAFVRVTGAGLSCPDWPLCFGAIVPEARHFEKVYGVYQEYIHRVLATLVGLISIACLYKAWRCRADIPRIWSASLFLFVLVVVQGVFGGLTVLMTLSPLIVTTHLVLGTVFLQAATAIAADSFMTGSQTSKPDRSRSRLLWCLALLVFAQLTLGGFTASSGSALACPDLPLCRGLFEAKEVLGPRLTVIAHALLGLLVLLIVSWLFLRGRLNQEPGARWLPLLLLAQIGIGWLTVYWRVPVFMSLIHLLTAQIILFQVVWLAMRNGPRFFVSVQNE